MVFSESTCCGTTVRRLSPPEGGTRAHSVFEVDVAEVLEAKAAEMEQMMGGAPKLTLAW